MISRSHRVRVTAAVGNKDPASDRLRPTGELLTKRTRKAQEATYYNELPPPTRGRRKHKTNFYLRCDFCYDLSETHVVLLLSYL
jgi:hypothetical protein